MANNNKEVAELLVEMQSESQILANAKKQRDAASKAGDTKTYISQDLFIHSLENQYRSESGKALDQTYSEIALEFAQQTPRPSTAKITNEAIRRGREQEKNDAIFKMDNRPRIEAYLKTKGHDITKQNIQNFIEKKLDEWLLNAKLNHRQEQIDQMAKQRPQSAPLPQSAQLPQPQTQHQNLFPTQPVIKPVVDHRLIAEQQRRNEQARQGCAQQLAQQKENNQGLFESCSQKFTTFNKSIISRSNSQASISTSASSHIATPQSQTNFYQTFNQPQQQPTRSQSQTSLYPTFDDIKPQQQLTRSQSQITSNPHDAIFKNYFPYGVKITTSEKIRPQPAPANNKIEVFGYPSL